MGLAPFLGANHSQRATPAIVQEHEPAQQVEGRGDKGRGTIAHPVAPRGRFGARIIARDGPRVIEKVRAT
jgi:hypothetical protein